MALARLNSPRSSETTDQARAVLHVDGISHFPSPFSTIAVVHNIHVIFTKCQKKDKGIGNEKKRKAYLPPWTV